MKKVISVLLAILLVAAMAVPAYAVQNGDDTEVSQSRAEIFKYMFAFFSNDEIETLSTKIAQEADYKIIVVYDDIQTVLVGVMISDNPQISNIFVFDRAVKKIVANTHEITADLEGNVVLLGTNRFAGELAMHMAVCMFMLMFEWTGIWENFDYTYHRYNYAEMDLDEERIPKFMMHGIGYIIMNIIRVFD
ncbi:MAG: hypothetical protein IJF40_07855 [Clostridia bacterium]|nr:hypothetical protein [Clostridia bacterium]